MEILEQRDQKDYAVQNTVEPVKPIKCGLHILSLDVERALWLLNTFMRYSWEI